MPKSKLSRFHQSAARPAAVWGGIGSALGGLAVIFGALGFGYHFFWPVKVPDASLNQTAAKSMAALSSSAVRSKQIAAVPVEDTHGRPEDEVIQPGAKD